MMYRKTLSIIIPYHNEKENMVEPLIMSINNQLNVDFNEIEIIISNNCDEPIKPSFLKNYPNLNIKYFRCPIKNNVGMSRQSAIDICTGRWLLMCDADDVLYSPVTLQGIFKDTELYKDNNVIHYQEKIEVSPQNFIDYGKNLVLVHGKVFNTDYLKINNVRFNPTVYLGADVYFNLIFDGTYPRHVFINRPIYIWKKNFSSESNSEQYYQRDAIDSIRRVYLAYKKIKTQYLSNILDYIPTDIYYAFLLGFNTIKKWEKQGLTDLANLNTKFLAIFIQELDPNLTCLKFDYANYEDKQLLDEFKQFASTSIQIYHSLDDTFYEENDLWI